jgi:hypothetical protein
MLSYLGLQLQVNRSLGRCGNTGQQKLYEFCYLLSFDCELSIWIRLFSYKDVTASFGNFLVLQGY